MEVNERKKRIKQGKAKDEMRRGRLVSTSCNKPAITVSLWGNASVTGFVGNSALVYFRFLKVRD